MNQGQDALDYSVMLGKEEIGPVAKAAFENRFPCGTVKECCGSGALDELVPAGCRGVGQLADDDTRHDATRPDDPAISGKTRSMRSQAKSVSSRRSRRSIRPMLT